MAARVHEHDLKVRHLRQRVGDSPELTAARVGRVASFRLTGFLGFPHGRPRSTSVGSVSTSEGLMCTNLISEWFDLLERSEM